MRAVVIDGFGGLDVLRVAELDDPTPGPREVLIDIHAASVNAADAKVRVGEHASAGLAFPHILGRDFSGVVSGVGDGADLEVGQHVFGVCQAASDGGQAERIAIDSAIVAVRPVGLDHPEAAALALIGITAITALEDVARLSPGQQILVQGGAGGVGGFAVQLATHLGAVVTTTASPQNHDYVRSLGADHVIDYTTEDFTELGPRFDVVYDTVGGEVQRRSAAVVRPGGALLFCAEGPEAASPSRSDITVIHPDVRRDRAHLDRISELVASGAVRPPTITRFALDRVADAHRLVDSRHLQGKLVLITPAGAREA